MSCSPPLVFNVQDPNFGARGDGVNDDYAAITAAITAATATGGITFFPPGTYLISQKLNGVPNKRNVLVGANRDSCTIRRSGPSGGTVLDWQAVGFTHLRSEFSSRIEELTFDGNNGTGVVVDILNLTLMAMCRVNVTGNGLGGSPANCVGLRISSTWDSRFDDVYVTTCGGTGANGPCVLLDTDTLAASGSLNNCQFYDLHIEPGPCDAILLQFFGNGTNQVGDNYFYGLKTHGDPASGRPNNSVVQLSMNANANVFFGHVLGFGDSATLGQVECDGQRNVWYSPTVGVSGTGGTPKYAFHFTAHAQDNVVMYPNIKTPNLYPTSGLIFAADASSLHNKILMPHGTGFASPPLSDSGSNLIWWDDLNNNRGLTIQNVGGLGNTATPARNLRGSVSITGAVTSAAVTFAAAEADALYFVALGARNAGGAPAAGSLRASASAVATTGFTINLEVAPGAGNTVRVDWVLVR